MLQFIPVTRDQILNQIKKYCIKEYSQIEGWVHGLPHVKRVVANGRKLARLEKLKAKDAFLVELACWLHDLGRVGEPEGLMFLESNHAEVSYLKSKDLLKPFEKALGRESVYKVLQAVREHNLPSLKHPENIIARVLLDADRGAGINLLGLVTMLQYLQVIQIEPVHSIQQARLVLAQLLPQLKNDGLRSQALQKASYLRDWYWGSASQSETGAVVAPLYTKSAKKRYKRGMAEIETFITALES